MSILRRLTGPSRHIEQVTRSAYPPGGWTSWLRTLDASNSVEQTLRNAASWACIDTIADALARTPFDVIQYRGPDRVPVVPVPDVIDRPSAISTVDVWRYQVAWSMLTDGNAFGQIVATGRGGYPTQIELIDPAQVVDRKVTDGVATVRVVGHDKPVRLWPHGDIWHVPGRMVTAGTPFARSPVVYAARTVGTSLHAEDFSFRFFADGGHPSALIYAESHLTPDQAADVKAAFVHATSGTSREPAVFGAGLRYETVQVPPGQTQFIDLMRFEVEQACRFWRVPPAMVYAATSGQNVTYANVTQADLHYLKHSLDGYYARLEAASTALLPRPQIVRANRNAILRADVQARYAAYTAALQGRFATVNEIRRLEDLPPFTDPAYDLPGIPTVTAPESESNA